MSKRLKEAFEKRLYILMWRNWHAVFLFTIFPSGFRFRITVQWAKFGGDALRIQETAFSIKIGEEIQIQCAFASGTTPKTLYNVSEVMT